mmetsp:Transcript_30826/g.89629  ORF Transcript_30826/g.89629 Transcript_30826/m.89629 type:complete len:230 (-) Transcript_30826:149-838(-)
MLETDIPPREGAADVCRLGECHLGDGHRRSSERRRRLPRRVDQNRGQALAPVRAPHPDKGDAERRLDGSPLRNARGPQGLGGNCVVIAFHQLAFRVQVCRVDAIDHQHTEDRAAAERKQQLTGTGGQGISARRRKGMAQVFADELPQSLEACRCGATSARPSGGREAHDAVAATGVGSRQGLTSMRPFEHLCAAVKRGLQGAERLAAFPTAAGHCEHGLLQLGPGLRLP